MSLTGTAPRSAKSITAGFAEIGVLSDAVDTDSLILRPFAIDRLVAIIAPSSPRPAARFRIT